MASMAEPLLHEEHFDVLTKTGQRTGLSKPRGDVHRDGDYHAAVHVWIFSESTQELLLQRRADCKDSWPGLWDISSAGHISAGDSSLITARRELHEELGVILPKDAFEFLFVFLQECVINDGKFINNEFNDVYLVTTLAPIPLEAFTLQGDVAFLAPPWGGPSYKTIPNFSLDLLKPKDGYSIFQAAQAITPNIIMFLPRNVDLRQVEELSWLSSPPLNIEIEENYVQNHLKGITAYFGGTAFGKLNL